MGYEAIAFSPAAKILQEKAGSRKAYQRKEQFSSDAELTDSEIEFISQRDSFYLASIGPSGYPYIQHRGGLKGFLKVVDDKTLAFADFSGNKQYITSGNVATEKKVSLILMDYAAGARLKIFARAERIDLNSNPTLTNLVTLPGYNAKVEGIMLLAVDAYDWNCPQHITPRYTQAEIDEALVQQHAYIAKLENELRMLKTAK